MDYPRARPALRASILHALETTALFGLPLDLHWYGQVFAWYNHALVWRFMKCH